MKRSANPQPSRRTSVPVTLGVSVLLVVMSLFLLLGKQFGWDARPGFFGTFAPFYADVNLIVQILLVAGLIIGFILIRLHQSNAHRSLTTSLVFFSLIMTVFFMGVKSIQMITSGVSISLIVLVEIFHSLMGTLAILAGSFLILRMNNALPQALRISWWKNLMRITFELYLFVGIGGMVLYTLLYIMV